MEWSWKRSAATMDWTERGPARSGHSTARARCWSSNSTVGSTPRAGSRSAGRGHELGAVLVVELDRAGRCGAGQCGGKGIPRSATTAPSSVPPDPWPRTRRLDHELDDPGHGHVLVIESSSSAHGHEWKSTLGHLESRITQRTRFVGRKPTDRVRMRVRAFSAIPEPLAVPTATRHPAASVPVAVPVVVLAASARARPRSGQSR
jgi:hypothetical protein